MWVALALGLLVFSASAQLNCGPFNPIAAEGPNVVCGALGPCCSEWGFCGTTAANCGGGCNTLFSVAGTCYSQRTNGHRCISGHYTLGDDSTWIVPDDSYNGNPQTADFTINRDGMGAANFRKEGGRLIATLTAPIGGSPLIQGQGVRLSSTSYISPGSVFSVRLRPSQHSGVVTAFISMADDRDEIDWEWTGAAGRLGQAQSNVFAKGVVDHTNAQYFFPGTTLSPTLKDEFHTYTIDWSSTRIQWLIDGVVTRTATVASLNGYPVSPARVQFAIWDGGYSSEGTRAWSGGRVDFTSPANVRSAIVESITIQCAGDPIPTGPPVRPAGWFAPNINTAPLANVVPGFPLYDPNTIGDGKISVANLETQQLFNPGSVTTTVLSPVTSRIPNPLNGTNPVNPISNVTVPQLPGLNNNNAATVTNLGSKIDSSSSVLKPFCYFASALMMTIFAF